MLSILVLITAVVVAANGDTIPAEISYCFENRECHITAIGGFSLTLPTTTTSEDTTTTTEVVEGYIFQVVNGLSYDMKFYWDAFSSHNAFKSSAITEQAVLHEITVKPG